MMHSTPSTVVAKGIYGNKFTFVEDDVYGAVIDKPYLMFDLDYFKSDYEHDEPIYIVIKKHGYVGNMIFTIDVLDKKGEEELEYQIDEKEIMHITSHFEGVIRLNVQSDNCPYAHDSIEFNVHCDHIKEIDYYVENVQYPTEISYDTEYVDIEFDSLTLTKYESGCVIDGESEHVSQTVYVGMNESEENDRIIEDTLLWHNTSITYTIVQKKKSVGTILYYSDGST